MSLPGLAAHSLSSMTSVALSPIEAILGAFNGNLYFIGLMMLILNLGGRFIVMEVSKDQELFFQHPWVRRFLIFVVLFVATRNIWISFWLTIAVVLVLGYLFNENSALCMFGKGGAPGASCAGDDKAALSGGGASAPPGGMTPEEKDIYRRLNEKKERYDQASLKEKEVAAKKSKYADPALVYMANLSLLKDA
jgi:hypothetical protein